MLTALVLVATCVLAQQKAYVHYFSARGDVSLPLTIKTNKGDYVIKRNGESITGNITIWEVRDGNGRKVMDTTADRQKATSTMSEYWYDFQYLYADSSQGSGSSSSESTSSYSSSGNPFEGLFSGLAPSGNYDDDCYPNFTMQAGLSNVYGEFIRAKGCLGGETGFVMYGGIGRDFLFSAKNPDFKGPHAKKSMTWHAGIGLYRAFTGGEFVFTCDYAETPLVENGSLNFWLGGTWYFAAEDHLGAFGGIGYSGGNLKQGEKMKGNFIFEVGVAYRLF